MHKEHRLTTTETNFDYHTSRLAVRYSLISCLTTFQNTEHAQNKTRLLRLRHCEVKCIVRLWYFLVHVRSRNLSLIPFVLVSNLSFVLTLT